MRERNQHMEKLPGILVKLRNQKGVTQREAAEAMGITFGVLSNYEKGQKAPSLDFAYKMADYYGVTLDELCGRTSTKERSTADVMRAYVVLRESLSSSDPIKFHEVYWRESQEAKDMWHDDKAEFEHEEDDNPGMHRMFKYAIWPIHKNKLVEFMKDYESAFTLVEDGALPRSVFEVWLKQELEEAEKRPW